MMRTKLITGGDSLARKEMALKTCRDFLDITITQSHPDLFVVEENKAIGIDKIREISRYLSLKPYQSKVKIALILAADKLTIPAQNALLKTLEEPNFSSRIILTAPVTENLLTTVTSRCQIIKIAPNFQTNTNQQTGYYQSLFASILSQSPGQLLKTASSLVKDRNQALELMEKLLVALRLQIQENPSLKMAQNLKKIQKSYQLVKANVNPHLCIGNLFLALVHGA